MRQERISWPSSKFVKNIQVRSATCDICSTSLGQIDRRPDLQRNLRLSYDNWPFLSVQCNSRHWTDIKSPECMSVCLRVVQAFRPR